MNDELRNLILNRMQSSGDFPAMYQTITLMSKLLETDEASVIELVNIILKDYSLTKNILRIVNSVGYAQRAEVTTVSRAIMVLGFKNIRNMALALTFFEHLQKTAQTEELKGLILQSLFTGIVAKGIAVSSKLGSDEESFICALFHNFGKMIVAFYLYDKLILIREYMKTKPVTETAACSAILGSSYAEIGMAIAVSWNIPGRVIQSMRRVTPAQIQKPAPDFDPVAAIASISSDITTIVMSDADEARKKAAISAYAKSLGTTFGSLDKSVDGILVNSASEINNIAGIFQLSLTKGGVMKRLMPWISADKMPKEISDARNRQEENAEAGAEGTALSGHLDGIIDDETSITPETIFVKGVQDIMSSIMGGHSLNDIIKIALETMYRGLHFFEVRRVLFFFRNLKAPEMNLRFGFCDNLEILKVKFVIPLPGDKDIISAALNQQKDFFIRDLQPYFSQKAVPAYMNSLITSDSAVFLLPIVMKGRPLGIFYLDGSKEGFSRIGQNHVNYLKMLRDQIILSIKQSSS